MQVQSINCMQNNTANFGRLSLRPIVKRNINQQSFVENMAYDISNILQISEDEIKCLIEKASKKRIKFLDTIVKNYNARNFYLDNNLKDSSETVINIFNTVKNPLKYHFDIIHNSKGSFKYIQEIFENASDKKSLKAVLLLQKELAKDENVPNKTIAKFLKSDYKDTYLNNIKDYIPFLKLNAKNENVVKILDDLVKDNRYDAEKYKKQVEIKELLDNSIVEKNFGQYRNILENNFSKKGCSLLEIISRNYIQYADKIGKDEEEHILDIYKTTNEKNYEIRKNLVQNFAEKNRYKNNLDDIEALKLLFNKIDKNTHVKNFVEKALSKNVGLYSAKEFNDVLENVEPLKAAIFIKNLKRIISKTQGEERINALKNEIENPWYQNPQKIDERSNFIKYGFAKPEGKLSKIYRTLENKFNILKYNILKGKTEHAEKAEMAEPVISLTREIKLSSQEETTPTIKISNKIKESSKERKIRLSKEVNDYIKTILGKKTYEAQNEAYSKDVTKMRLKLLPEIFASIKETGKHNRALKQRVVSENRDAIKLYQMINGKNRKLIRYMLLKRNGNNDRMFEVKDIYKYISKAEAQIAKNKKANKNYKPQDAKEFYETLYLDMINKYGKNKISRRKNK